MYVLLGIPLIVAVLWERYMDVYTDKYDYICGMIMIIPIATFLSMSI
jgi:hypothetical protein